MIEGGDLGFRYNGQACLRTAQILPGDPTVSWLERHLLLTQLFVGLGTDEFLMVLAPPNHDSGADLPDLSAVVDALQGAGGPRELHEGDVHKISLADRFGVRLRPSCLGAVTPLVN